MGWTISLGSVAGTRVRLHLTFFIFLVWLGAIAWAQGGPPAAAASVSFIVLLFVCVVLHEFGHVLAARRFGVPTPEIIILPIGGVSKLERIPEKPLEELIMALAGPAVTLVIALALIAALGGIPNPQQVFKEMTPRAIAGQLAYANISLFFFNLLPAFPLDGGRVLRAILARFTGHLRGTEIAAAIGKVAAVILGIFALATGNFILLIIAVFIFIAAGSEAGMAQIRGLLFNLPAREVMITEFHSLTPDAPVSDAANELIRTSQTDFPVVDEAGRFVGLLSRDGIIKALSEKGGNARVGDAMQTDIKVISEWHRLDDGLDVLQSGSAAVAVIGTDGRLVGLITAENLLEKMMIARARDRHSTADAFTSVPKTRL